jgi:hypothetical protein
MFSNTQCDVDSIKVIDFGLSQKFARNEHLRDAVGTVYTMSPGASLSASSQESLIHFMQQCAHSQLQRTAKLMVQLMTHPFCSTIPLLFDRTVDWRLHRKE